MLYIIKILLYIVYAFFQLLCLTGICILYESEKHNAMTNVNPYPANVEKMVSS